MCCSLLWVSVQNTGNSSATPSSVVSLQVIIAQHIDTSTVIIATGSCNIQKYFLFPGKYVSKAMTSSGCISLSAAMIYPNLLRAVMWHRTALVCTPSRGWHCLAIRGGSISVLGSCCCCRPAQCMSILWGISFNLGKGSEITPCSQHI